MGYTYIGTDGPTNLDLAAVGLSAPDAALERRVVPRFLTFLSWKLDVEFGPRFG